jgi:nitrite reductase/ring-hydroxylating ferredoxin subunit
VSATSGPRESGTRHEVCPVEAIPPGERRIVEVDGLSIGVFNVDGEFYALANVCPHQLAELCRGEVGGVVTSEGVGDYGWEREGQVVRCPRHKWAFDVTTGESVFNPHLRTRTFDVEVEERAGENVHGDGEGDDAEPDAEPETARQVEEYGTTLSGDEPPVDTYDVEVEDEVVVLYV